MEEPTQRFDVVFVPEARSDRIPQGMGVALLRYLAAGGIAIPTEEAVARTWAEVYLKPGPTSHVPFLRHENPGDEPAFVEGVLRVADAPFHLDYGAGLDVCFALEFCGCRFDGVAGTFKTRLLSLFQLRVDMLARPHAGLPEHRTVPEGEEPEPVAKREGRSPVSLGVGVRVLERD